MSLHISYSDGEIGGMRLEFVGRNCAPAEGVVVQIDQYGTHIDFSAGCIVCDTKANCARMLKEIGKKIAEVLRGFYEEEID